MKAIFISEWNHMLVKAMLADPPVITVQSGSNTAIVFE